MSEILDNIYIWVFSVNSESVLLLAFVKYLLYSHCTENSIFCRFWRLNTLVLWRKIVQNLLIFMYLFCPKNNTIDSRNTSITQERLVVESCPTTRWIAFLMLYQLVYNTRSDFNELIFAWSAYLKRAMCWWSNFGRSSFQSRVFPALVSFFKLSDIFFDFVPIFKCHTQSMERINSISRSLTLCWIFWRKFI